jgi:pyruvate/2-oxoglutarate/acetoin dehydrogenase E1 component
MVKIIKYTEAINLSLDKLMKKNKNVLCYGLGINDPKNIFNTTKNLLSKYGKKRVFDIPTSENALTGVAVGLAINNLIPIFIHQRFDFFLLAMDQLVNTASKWNFMFGRKKKITMVFRLIVGRGWGQGPTHSQNYLSWFANVPNLKIFCPTFPSDVYNFYQSIPIIEGTIIVIEHRWLHFQKEESKNIYKKIDNQKCNYLNYGNDLTIISYSYSTIEIKKIYKILKENQISFDHIDLRCLKPIDYNSIIKSVSKTGKLLILDNMSFPTCSIGKDIISSIAEKNNKIFKKPPKLLTLPDVHTPTSHYLTKKYYNDSNKIILNIEKLLNKKIIKKINNNLPHDIPDKEFNGPF